ncbi:ABC transporter permease [Hathewaya histolytica]|uniref:ABC transporter permease n=1 Tax=Hathewaya histolytica TaxID=1498 RepID=UPI003B67C39A
MRNYIKSEFYRIIHRRYYHLSVLIYIVLSIIGSLTLKFWGTKITTNPFLTSMNFLTITIVVSPFVLYSFQDIVLGDELKHNTLNNAVASGISRSKIILSKIITTAAVSMLFSIIVIVVHILMSVALFGVNEEGIRSISQYSIAYLSAIPLWMGFIAFYNVVCTIIQNQVIAGITIFTVVFITPKATQLITYFKPKLSIIHELQPYSVLKRLIKLLDMKNISSIDWFTVCFGLGFFIISTSVAIIGFRKRDF